MKQRPMIAPGPGDLLGLGRPMAEAREHGVLDRVRDGRLADRQAVRARLRAERPEQLLDVERDAVGSLVDRVRDLARGREAGVEDQRRDERGLRPGERRQPDLLGDALGQQPRPPVAQARAGRGLVGPVAAARGAADDRATGGRARR